MGADVGHYGSGGALDHLAGGLLGFALDPVSGFLDHFPRGWLPSLAVPFAVDPVGLLAVNGLAQRFARLLVGHAIDKRHHHLLACVGGQQLQVDLVARRDQGHFHFALADVHPLQGRHLVVLRASRDRVTQVAHGIGDLLGDRFLNVAPLGWGQAGKAAFRHRFQAVPERPSGARCTLLDAALPSNFLVIGCAHIKPRFVFWTKE